MQEIEVKENPLKVKAFINGTPDLKNIPKEKAESILAALNFGLIEFWDKRRIRLKYYRAISRGGLSYGAGARYDKYIGQA